MSRSPRAVTPLVAILACLFAGCGKSASFSTASTATAPSQTTSSASTTAPPQTTSSASTTAPPQTTSSASTTAPPQTTSSASTTAPPQTTSSASTAPDASSPTTPAKALAFAHAVNLRPGDLPGFVPTSPEQQAPAPTAGAERFARCAGATDPAKRVADVRSASFRLGSGGPAGEIKSSVEVMPSAQLARRSFAAAESARGRACLSKLLPSLLGPSRTGASYSHLAISVISTPLAGSDSFGYRIRVRIGAKRPARGNTPLSVYIDAFELLDGPAEIGVTDLSVLRPPARETEGLAIKAVAARVRSNSL